VLSIEYVLYIKITKRLYQFSTSFNVFTGSNFGSFALFYLVVQKTVRFKEVSVLNKKVR
jgi:hypothetical protein